MGSTYSIFSFLASFVKLICHKERNLEDLAEIWLYAAEAVFLDLAKIWFGNMREKQPKLTTTTIADCSTLYLFYGRKTLCERCRLALLYSDISIEPCTAASFLQIIIRIWRQTHGVLAANILYWA